MMKMNQSFDDDNGDLDFVAECDSDIDVSDSVFTLQIMEMMGFFC